MKFLRPVAILTFFSLLLLLASCSSPSGSSNDAANSGNRKADISSSNTANGNAGELGMLINFTWEPEDLTWNRNEQKKLVTAVFRLDADDQKKLLEQLAAKPQGARKEIQLEEWFPAELIAQGESAGGSSVSGNAQTAEDYFQPPYNEGTITRIEGTDFFIIEVWTK